MKNKNSKNRFFPCKSATILFAFIGFSFNSFGQSVPSFSVLEKACEGVEVSFVNTTQIAAGDTLSYNWIISDGSVSFSTLENPTYAWNFIGEHTVRLIIENQNGDTSSVSKSISIKQVPLSNFMWDQACEGIPIAFLGDEYSLDTFGDIVYTWSFGDSIKTGREVYNLYNLVSTQTVSLVIASDHGCRDTLVRTIDIKEFIPVDFEVASVCVGDSACFTNLTGDITKEYIWDFGDGIISRDYNVCHTYPAAKTFNVTLSINHDGCNDQITKGIIVNPLPVSYFTYGVNNDKVVFDGPSGNNQYRWTLENGGGSKIEDPTFLREEVWATQVCLATSRYDCWNESCSEVFRFAIGVTERLEEFVKVYPNPSQGLVIIDLPVLAEVIVLDLNGKIISPPLNRSPTGYRLDLNGFPSGVYTIRVTSEDTVLTKQIVLMK
jgi:PKD repeat protein